MKTFFFFFLFSFFFLSSCSKDDKKADEAVKTKLKLVSVNYPLHYFSQRIGDVLIKAEYPIPNDVDPAYWKPDEKALAIYQSADLIIDNGAQYAKWMEKVSLPTSKLVNSSKSFKNGYVELDEGTTHSHGPEGEHVHVGHAFTTWLNFAYAQKQAEAIKGALTVKMQDMKDLLQDNFDKLNSDLGMLDSQMKQIASSLSNKTLYGSHPVYQYLAAGYGITIISEHWEPDEMPSSERWQTFEDKVNKHKSNIMLWEDQPLPEVEEKLRSLGITVVVFSPCANMPENGDFMAVMHQNLANLQAAVR